jgi:hypothetical protein
VGVVNHYMDVGDIGGGSTSLAAQQTAVEVSMAVLAKTLQAQTNSATNLLEAMPKLPPIGSVGQNVDLRA